MTILCSYVPIIRQCFCGIISDVISYLTCLPILYNNIIESVIKAAYQSEKLLFIQTRDINEYSPGSKHICSV